MGWACRDGAQDAEDGCHVRFGEVLPVAQDDDRPLPGGQAGQRAEQGRVGVDCLQVTFGTAIRLIPHPAGGSNGELSCATGPLLCTVDRQVDQDPASVCGRVIHGTDLVPAAGHPQQGLLHEVFGLGQVPASR